MFMGVKVCFETDEEYIKAFKPVYDKKNNSILIHKVCIDYTTGTIK